jgi:hypothetical protein
MWLTTPYWCVCVRVCVCVCVSMNPLLPCEPQVRRVVLASRHYGRLRTRLLPPAQLCGGAAADHRHKAADGHVVWEGVSEEQYAAAAVRRCAGGVEMPLQGQLMPLWDHELWPHRRMKM